jgi:hypothetical protein
MKKTAYFMFFCCLSLTLMATPLTSSVTIEQLTQGSTLIAGIIGLIMLRALPLLRQIFSFNRYVRILGHDPHIVVPPATQCKNKTPIIILPGYNSWRSALPKKEKKFAVTTTPNTVHITIRFADTIRREYRWLPLQWLKCIASASIGQKPDAIALLCGLIECYEQGYTKIHSFWYSRGGPAGIYALDMLINPENYVSTWQSLGYTDSQGYLNYNEINNIYRMVVAGKISITYPILNYPGTLKQCLNTALKTVHNYIRLQPAQRSKKTVWSKCKRAIASVIKRLIYSFGVCVLHLITRYRKQKQEPITVLLRLVNKRPELSKNLVVNFAKVDQITGNIGKRRLEKSNLITTKTYNGDHFSINLPLKDLQRTTE